MNPFDIIKDISYKKEGLISKHNESEYVPFLTNRHFSYFSDTIYYANLMNLYSFLDNQLQHDYLINIIRKNNRFTKWNKKDNKAVIEAVQKYYGYSESKAKEAIKLLNNEQLDFIFKIGRAHV